MDSSLCILGLGSIRYILSLFLFMPPLTMTHSFCCMDQVSLEGRGMLIFIFLLCCPLRVVATAGCPHLDPKVMHSCMTFGSIGTTKDELLEPLLVICIEIFCDFFSDDSYQLIQLHHPKTSFTIKLHVLCLLSSYK